MSLLPYKVTALARVDNGDLNIIPNASVTVLTSGGTYAQIYEADGTTPILNPFNCDDNGERQIYLSSGSYTISVAGGQSWDVRLSGASDIQSVATIADLVGLSPEDGQVFSVSRFHSDFLGGGGEFTYNASRPRADHDGGTVIDSSKAFPGAWNNTTIASWYTADGAGTGCYERTFSGAAHINWFGAKANWTGSSGTDNSLVIEQVAKKYSNVDMTSVGKYYCATQIGLGDRENYIFEEPLALRGGHLVINAPSGLFTSSAAKANPATTANAYTGVLKFEDITFSQSAVSRIFNADYLYEFFVKGCRFIEISKVSKAFRPKPGYPIGYSQSSSFVGNWFLRCARDTDNLIIDHSLSFDFTFCENRLNACHGGIKTIAICCRVNGNLYQDGGRFLELTNSRGEVSGNYLEGNRFGAMLTSSNPSEILINESLTYVFPSSIAVKSNNFQPSGDMLANPAYSIIRLPGQPIGGTRSWWDVSVEDNSVDGFASTVSLLRVVSGGVKSYKNNSFKPSNATDSLNSAFDVHSGFKYTKNYTASCAPSTTTNLIFTLASGGAGDLEFKVNVFTTASAPGGVKRFRVSGNISTGTGNYQIIELSGDTYTSAAITFGTITKTGNVVTLPVNVLNALGYDAFVEVSGMYRGGSAGFDSKTADVCVITKS